MNKTAKIIIGALSILVLFFVLMAQIQRTEADKQKGAVFQSAEMAQKSQQEAEKQAELALVSAAHATEAQIHAEKIMKDLQECQNSQ
ncbi:MAG: hypothetical protein RIG77_09035 [Cyclobacteriaceae bacterium]